MLNFYTTKKVAPEIKKEDRDFEEENINSLQSSLSELLSESDESDQNDFMHKEDKRTREEVLAIKDVTEIGADEYVIFLDYTIANLYQIMTSEIKIKKTDRATVEEMAKESISYAIQTYNIEKAEDANGTFKTHLGWKARARVTTYIRDLVKAQKIMHTESSQKKYMDIVTNKEKTYEELYFLLWNRNETSKLKSF